MVILNKKIKRNLVLATIFLAVIAFIAGVIIGKSISSTKQNEITQFLKESELRTESYMIEQALAETFEEDNCELAKIRIEDLSEELYKIGKIFETNTTEETLGKENFDLLKRKYHLMQIRTYILFHKIIKNCRANQDVVLFYFGRNDTKSAEQGKILDQIVKEKNIIVYAVEFNYSSDLRFLEKYYGINKQPALVINYETIKQGPTQYDEIIRILENEKH